MVDPLKPVGALSALGDPTRRRAYDYVSAQGGPAGRDEVATALGIGRTLAAYHLDRLAKEGLLSVAYARRWGRTGPGAGRPAKLYERAATELAVRRFSPDQLYKEATGVLLNPARQSSGILLLDTDEACATDSYTNLIIRPSSAFVLPHQIVAPPTDLTRLPYPIVQRSLLDDAATIGQVLRERGEESDLPGLSIDVHHAVRADLPVLANEQVPRRIERDVVRHAQLILSVALALSE